VPPPPPPPPNPCKGLGSVSPDDPRYVDKCQACCLYLAQYMPDPNEYSQKCFQNCDDGKIPPILVPPKTGPGKPMPK
jgi:hypothetical protein